MAEKFFVTRLFGEAVWLLSHAERCGAKTTESFMSGPYFDREAFERDLRNSGDL